MFRLSWAICLSAGLAALVGILIVTRDLAVTNATFKDGVVQAQKVDSTTDKALASGLELPPAQEALQIGMPQVLSIAGSLQQANGTLSGLSNQLGQLGATLASADKPLADIISAANSSSNTAGQAVAPAKDIVGELAGADKRVQQLGPLLDETLASAQRIEAKLHVLRAIPE